MDLELRSKISTIALSTLNVRKFNKNEILPLTADLLKLNQYLENEMENLMQSCEPDNWKIFRQVLLARIILFNKRRSGEA